ncbi:MAG: YggS family pyridoxal phosphate-dependent enzyme [Bacteroidota bacterium]|nr:YggS family pyridoxal phosphate-dependent enzyme [Bacteroidota bacterium]MDE2834382.1 YggS family pyridoxal phosphate-dependent enzyme [Bacteroidota bacterium]MDE2955941.1 YggS family pyridoxal phosphate-dependent enzyme [Bacteroidota bacterium]
MVEAIAERLTVVREKIEAACARAGRSVDSVTLIAVTKTFPAAVVEQAIAAGLRDFGENKVQELTAKAAAIPPEKCRWHMIGHLQRNKARQVVRCADTFHALDSRRLAAALDRQAKAQDRVLPCFVQVNVSREPTKSGFLAEDVGSFLMSIGQWDNLKPVGLMTLAAHWQSGQDVRGQFRQMRQLRDRYEHLGGTALSMGMSGDYELAIAEGATHIRVGSAIFGPRTRY